MIHICTNKILKISEHTLEIVFNMWYARTGVKIITRTPLKIKKGIGYWYNLAPYFFLTNFGLIGVSHLTLGNIHGKI